MGVARTASPSARAMRQVGLFPVYADLGFFPKEWLDSYTRLGSPLGDHPDMRKVPGVDFSSGSIGPCSVERRRHGAGAALDRRRLQSLLHDGRRRDAGRPGVGSGRYALRNHKLKNLIAIVDRNGFQLDGKVDDVMNIEPLDEKWRAFGWEVHVVDGHDIAATTELLRRVKADSERQVPCCIIARTSKGKGVFLYGDRTRAGISAISILPMPMLPSLKSIPGRSDMNGPLSPQFLAVSRPQFGQSRSRPPVERTDRTGQGRAQCRRRLRLTCNIPTGSTALRRPIRIAISRLEFPSRTWSARQPALPPAASRRLSPPSRLSWRCCACEQIRMDVAYSAQPVRLDRPSHRYLARLLTAPRTTLRKTSPRPRSIADLTVVSPADGAQLEAAIAASADHDRPIYFRIGRGRDSCRL